MSTLYTNPAPMLLRVSRAQACRGLDGWLDQSTQRQPSGLTQAFVNFLSTVAAEDAWTITQRDGGSKSVRVRVSRTDATTTSAHAAAWSLPRASSALRAQLAATFLPAGYPASVSPGYLRYVWWQALHHSCSAANGVLASTFMLYSVGLGAGAIPTAGALNWALKDGFGQLGKLLFGRAIAHNFDVASRRWYLLASAKLNLAIGLEICSFLAPQHFLALGSAANAVKGLAWMAGGSSRSAFNVAFAADRNIGDVTAKATSQTICTSLVGTSLGVGLAAAVGQSSGAALGCYAALAATHMWSGYQSARSVPLSTLNPSRAAALVGRHIEGTALLEQRRAQAHHLREGKQRHPQLDPAPAALPTPAELAPHDPFFQGSGAWLRVGSQLQTLVASAPAQAAALLPLYRHRRHIVLPGPGGAMHIVLHEGADARDAMLAVLHAALWRRSQAHKLETTGIAASPELGSLEKLSTQSSAGAASAADGAAWDAGSCAAALEAADAEVDALLVGLASAGWDTGRVVLEATRRRAVW